MSVQKKRIVIVGFGDCGVLSAIYLGDKYDIVAISTKPCLVSGQELGSRLTKPQNWKAEFLIPFSKFKKLEHVTIIQGIVSSINPQTQTVHIIDIDGTKREEVYDSLLLCSGVTSGFWRNDTVEDILSIQANLETDHEVFTNASRVVVVGGGVCGVSAASNLKDQFPQIDVHLFFSREKPLPYYHPDVRKKIESVLKEQGVILHPNSRVHIPDDTQTTQYFTTGEITLHYVHDKETVFSFNADVVLWAVGMVKPNNSFIPADMLDERGYVKADKFLRVPNYPNVFTVGDIAATNARRTSARDSGYMVVAFNIKAYLEGYEDKMEVLKPSYYHWGSVLGLQKNGMFVCSTSGKVSHFSSWVVNNLLHPATKAVVYKGMKTDKPLINPDGPFRKLHSRAATFN
eukprot:Filipodium_phascolosomae@DN1801_c0_g1_i1.p1